MKIQDSSLGRYELSHLDALESEAVFIIREVAAECERPVLLFSGGKDSAVLLHIAEQAFRPAALPFPIMHIDTEGTPVNGPAAMGALVG